MTGRIVLDRIGRHPVEAAWAGQRIGRATLRRPLEAANNRNRRKLEDREKVVLKP
ncbi:hypothetical protein [Streptosporangium saharense]|uniref:hypothetical protein n=1 Tax=Streptosporangium saharense TaxID=1706840 RepID=UPI00341834BE